MRNKTTIIIGSGNECPKCRIEMERRGHKNIPKDKVWYFIEWDYCKECKHVQHYEKYKEFVKR